MVSLNRKHFISGVLLASGASRRFKSPKQLIKWQGEYLINHVIKTILQSKIDKLFVVLGSHYEDIQPIIDARPTVVFNPDWKIGKSSSIRLGVRVAEKMSSNGIMFLLVDQPNISEVVINRLVDVYFSSEKNIIAPTINTKQRNPVLFRRKYFDKLKKLEKEQGGKEIIKSAKDVEWVSFENERIFMDIDTLDDFKLIQSHSSPSSTKSS